MHISPITKYPQRERCVLDIIPNFFGLKVRVIKSFKNQAYNHICPLGIEGFFFFFFKSYNLIIVEGGDLKPKCFH